MTRRDQANVRRGKREFLNLGYWDENLKHNRWRKRYGWHVVRREDALAARREVELCTRLRAAASVDEGGQDA